MTALTRVPQLPNNLPSIANAKLPQMYESAREALTECYRVDECKDWADKAAALASYAKQAQDNTLYETAAKIHGRAIKRVGELLQKIEAKHTGRPAKSEERTYECGACNEHFSAAVWHCPVCAHHWPDERDSCWNCHKHNRQTGTKLAKELGPAPDLINKPTRKGVASDAKLSRRQQRTALRVANIPDDEFEELIEQSPPPTVTELAERGKKPAPRALFDLKGRDPKDFQACTAGLGVLRDLHAFAIRTDPKAIVRGASEKERARMIDQIPPLLGWLNDLLSANQEQK